MQHIVADVNNVQTLRLSLIGLQKLLGTLKILLVIQCDGVIEQIMRVI